MRHPLSIYSENPDLAVSSRIPNLCQFTPHTLLSVSSEGLLLFFNKYHLHRYNCLCHTSSARAALHPSYTHLAKHCLQLSCIFRSRGSLHLIFRARAYVEDLHLKTSSLTLRLQGRRLFTRLLSLSGCWLCFAPPTAPPWRLPARRCGPCACLPRVPTSWSG